MTVRHGTANIATPHVRTPSPAPSGHLGLRRIVFRWRQLLGLLSKVLPTLWWMVAWLHKHKCQHQAMALPTLCSVWPVAAPNQSSTPTSQDCAYTKCKPGPISCRATGAQFAGAATAPTKATFGFARKAAGSGSGSGNNSCNKHSSPEGTCPAKWWRPRHTRQQSPPAQGAKDPTRSKANAKQRSPKRPKARSQRPSHLRPVRLASVCCCGNFADLQYFWACVGACCSSICNWRKWACKHGGLCKGPNSPPRRLLRQLTHSHMWAVRRLILSPSILHPLVGLPI